MSLTVRIVWKHILSQVRVSVRPSNVFIREKHPKYRDNLVASACGYLNSQRSALSQAERTVTVGRHRIVIACAADDGCVHARVWACVMCLQYTIKYLTQADNNLNYPIFHTNQTLMISPHRVYRLVFIIRKIISNDWGHCKWKICMLCFERSIVIESFMIISIINVLT